MRITNSMTRNNVLWSINKTEEKLDFYQTQMSTGKKIQRPSEDPIVAVRALKFRTNVREVSQYQTNSEDAISWLSTSEQSISNASGMLNRIRDLSLQATSDTFSINDVDTMVAEIEQIKVQLVNEGNVSYAGRYIYSGFKTETPLVYTSEPFPMPNYTITEHFESSKIEPIDKAFAEVTPPVPSIPPSIDEVFRLRLGYGNLDGAAVSVIDKLTGVAPAGFTITEYDSSDTFLSGGADISIYKPEANNIHIIKDTGEIIFNTGNVDGSLAVQIPENLDVTYDKTSFNKYDMVPENYFDCVNNNMAPPHNTYTKPSDHMSYQVSFNQEIIINSTGNEVISSDLIRDLEEIIKATKEIVRNGSINEDLQTDVIGKRFNQLIGKMDKHTAVMLKEQAIIGSKINRLDLTINRLSDNKNNYIELLSKNEDVNMTEAVLNLQAQEIVYNAALMSSSKIMQQSLLDFLR